MSQRTLVEAFSSLSDLSRPVEERCRAFLALMKHPLYRFYDRAALQTVEFVSASEGRTEWEFTVTEEMCNSSGALHGGCAATILDDLTSTPAFTIAKEGFLDSGTMSRTLSLTFLRALREGDKAKVVAKVLQAGKTLVHFQGDILTEDGKVAVTCVHDKLPRFKSKI